MFVCVCVGGVQDYEHCVSLQSPLYHFRLVGRSQLCRNKKEKSDEKVVHHTEFT